jgi:outer membrane receptor protein involved in Fe transport
MKVLLRCFMIVAFIGISVSSFAQGVTTGGVSGIVSDETGAGLPGATVLAVHEPSGTRYGTSTQVDGRFNIVGMRVGGPYTVTVSFVGYESQAAQNVQVTLGGTVDLQFTLRDASAMLEEVLVMGVRDAVFNSRRTGASTSISQEALTSLPSISRRIGDFTRLTPQANGSSFAGQDNRLNNITVDGSYFNNSFGLAGQPGDRTGVAPISLDAIEEISVNIAPFDVRQANFVGAGVNTVTKSGTNQFKGSAFYNTRNQNFVGTDAGDFTYDPGTFDFKEMGLSFGGPIIKNKLFFFASLESQGITEPGTTYKANSGSDPIEGRTTRVLASDLDALSTYLRNNFNYETGPYQDYSHETPATRILLKLDYNINDRNKLSLRYNHLDSKTDVLLSNSSSLGFGSRRTSLFGLNFQNSNYQILENIRSIVGELNTRIGDNMANNLILGYTYHDESRDSRGTFFPMVDVLEGGSVYTTFGFEPFTPNNELRYNSFQLQNNFTIFADKHTLTFGLSAERYESENIFFPGSQSAYVYNSLADFYTDANDYLANPDRTASPVSLRRFQVRYSAQPGLDKPVQPLEVFYAGVYAQDEWQATDNLKLTVGLRIDMPIFGDTGLRNPEAESFLFRDENGDVARFATDKLPDPKIHWSPRLGFNWDVTGDRSTQIRGGSGIFTGRPAYVWISNQIGNNGVMTGFVSQDNTSNYPFHPDPNHYKPTITTVEPAPSYELALTNPDFKFPQIWRNNIAIDQKLPFGIVGTLEAMYSRDVNGIYYINANLANSSTNFTGPDTRERWTAGNRINSKITSAIVLKNQNVGYSYNISASLEKPFSNGFFAKVAYNYGVAKNTVDPGSIAFGSWNNNQHSGNPNNPGLAYSVYNPGHRVFASVTYRKDYFSFGATQIGLFWETANIGNASYVFSGDLNGDGGTSNDLIYVPKDVSEMNFQEYTQTSGVPTPVTFTVAEQQAAWDAYITQDKYLSKMRGKYVERNGLLLPMISRADLSLMQEFHTNFGGNRNAIQFRIDILNVGNLLNKDWGVAQVMNSTSPLIARGADGDGKAQYRLRNIGGVLMTETYRQSVGLGDVYRFQFGVRYIFN